MWVLGVRQVVIALKRQKSAVLSFGCGRAEDVRRACREAFAEEGMKRVARGAGRRVVVAAVVAAESVVVAARSVLLEIRIEPFSEG